MKNECQRPHLDLIAKLLTLAAAGQFLTRNLSFLRVSGLCLTARTAYVMVLDQTIFNAFIGLEGMRKYVAWAGSRAINYLSNKLDVAFMDLCWLA